MADSHVPTLLADLTLAEKASLCSGSDFWHTQGVDRLGIPAVMLTDGPHGLRKQAGAADHLGLSDSVPATCFPPAVGLGSSWDPELAERVGAALGVEARAEHVAVLLGPGINIKRSPLCGRNFEYFSEDPLLSGVMGAAMVRGTQSQGVGTSLKHFAANNQEADRMRVSAEVDERTLREIYLRGFEEVIRTAAPWTVMCSYNKVNGIYASEHPWLLNDVLRAEWGFDGLVMSDWGAVSDRVAGLHAGLDLEMPSSGGYFDAAIIAAVRSGALPQAVLDRAVERLLVLLDRSGDAVRVGGTFDAAAHHELAHQVGRECAVLLKNENELLPLDPNRAGLVAVIGEFARTPRYQGAGSSLVNPTRVSTALQELRELAGPRLQISFAPGYAVDDTQDYDPGLLDAAVEDARAADEVVLFLGLPPSYESEGWDREHLDLPPEQLALITAVTAVNPNVAVVLSNGSVVAVADWEFSVSAILEGWLLGQAGGAAIADLIFGIASPSGRLTETIPLRLEDNPSYGNFPGENGVVHYGEGLLVGYRHYDSRDLEVSFPFGHGLTYTTFEYQDLSTTVTGTGPDVEVSVSVTVQNTGAVAGREVVQVYVHDLAASVFRPEHELKAFAKISLAAGERTTIELRLDHRAFSYFHTGLGRWVVEAGEFELRVGASSRDIRQRRVIEVASDPVSLPLTPMSSLAEFLADPVTAVAIRAMLGLEAGAGLEGDDMLKMMASAPLERMVRFPNPPITPAQLTELLALTA